MNSIVLLSILLAVATVSASGLLAAALSRQWVRRC